MQQSFSRLSGLPKVDVYRSFCGRIAKILAVLGVACFFLLLADVALQIGARHLLHTVPLWTLDGATLTLVWLTFIEAALLVRTGGHFVIDLLPKNTRKLTRLTNWIGVAIVGSLLIPYVFYGFRYAFRSFYRLSGMSGISMTFFVIAIPISGIFMLLFLTEAILVSTPEHSLFDEIES